MLIWMLIGILLASLVVILIFFLINKYITRKGPSKGYFEPCNPPVLNVENNIYLSKKLEEVVPPLPPRTQFDSDSYESIRELPEYIKVDEEEAMVLPPPTKTTQSCSSVDMSLEDYDDIGEENHNQGEDYDDVG
ncbi:unnamed protein product [Gadus morhua 'NCC']